MNFSIINVAVVICLFIGPIDGNKCLGNFTDARTRNVYFEGKPLNITLQASNKITQNLFNHILKIILVEVLGYERVNFVEKTISSNFSIMVEKLFDSNESLHLHRKIPSVMINLEVPISPDIDYKNTLDVYLFSECGNIAPSGRYGWFIPRQLYDLSPGGDHWEYFLHSNQTDIFNLDLYHTKILENFAYNNETKQFYCDADYCNDGYYTPEQCKSITDSGSCAILLTSHPETTEFIVEHVRELKLYVKVLWLGNNLKAAIDVLTDSIRQTKLNKSIIFLEWTPGYFTFEYDKFKSVYLPRCEDFAASSAQKCIYEMSRSVKLVWSELRNIAKPAFEVIYKMNFDQIAYESLLEIYKHNGPYADTACDWLQKNSMWHKWLPSNSDKKNIYIGGIFPLTGVMYNAHGIVLAARMAQDVINSNSSILRDYNLKLLVNDGQCHADMVLKTFIDYIYHNEYRDLIGILGPACSETLEPLAGVSKHYSTVVISYSAEGSTFSDRSRYPYFFRSNGENDQYKQVYLHLFRELKWNRVAALTEDGQKYTEYISSMGNLLQTNGMTLIVNLKFSSNRKESSIIRHLEDLKEKRAKIIIADIYDNIARIIMCQAYNLNMIGKHGYVWFLPSWLSHNWYNTTHFNTHFNENVNCSVEAMIEAITGHFSLQHASFAPDDDIMQENISVKTWRTKYLKRVSEWSRMQSIITANTSLVLNDNYASDYAGYAYDAVWIYALAAEKLLQKYPESFSDMHSEFTTMNLVDIIRQTEFNGVSGKMKFYGGPSRFSTIHIKQWLNESIIVGYFTPNISNLQGEMSDGTLHLNVSEICWQTPSGMKPEDGFVLPDECLLQPLADLLSISCDYAIILVNVVSFAVFGLLLSTFIILLKRKYDKKIKLTEDFMTAFGFDKSAAINLSSLDKWETARECVVINRKLGEGAFGTVYGGEALLTEGDGWVAVAVKTLKIGANREEKLDFLSEAESMKRFDHKNIVRLLGVCTKNEPFYTIMEYMLYGDLKTYLLARRHLVNGMYTEEKEEVSCKKLTSMALDIARALSYLAELKYVHRDVACRNCLINAQRVVKLGDFGMSRLIFENDYYRFNRKGMLPVRWMAPESLCLGIFTPASDVWSFAILLYEIITFGNFPFQGMSNNEVLEYVKNGNTLTIPPGVKPQLEGLMKSCWNMDYKIRPNASEVAEFLANSPRLLSPCLDVPLSSVAMDFSDDIDILPEIFNSQMVADEINKPENEITNITGPISQHFDNPSYIIAEINRTKKKKTRKRQHRDIIMEESQTNDEVIPFI